MKYAEVGSILGEYEVISDAALAETLLILAKDNSNEKDIDFATDALNKSGAGLTIRMSIMLQEYAPPYCFFGVKYDKEHKEDWGFWPTAEAVEIARGDDVITLPTELWSKEEADKLVKKVTRADVIIHSGSDALAFYHNGEKVWDIR